MTHIFLLIFPSPLVGRYSVFDFYSFPNVGRDRVVVFPTTLNHRFVLSVIQLAGDRLSGYVQFFFSFK